MPFAYSLRTERFDPASSEPFRVSRTTLANSLDCLRCAVLKLRYGADRVATPPYTINGAIDTLLKREFDVCRSRGEAHPLFAHWGLEHVRPFAHPDLDAWRDTRRGVEFLHEGTNLIVYGALDDLWVLPGGALAVPDYKATAKVAFASIAAPWQIAYKRQVEVYQWILRGRDYEVSDIAYFLYANGDPTKDPFTRPTRSGVQGIMEFRLSIHAYVGDDHWVEDALVQLHAALLRPHLPPSGDSCEYCSYRAAVADIERSFPGLGPGCG